VAPVDGLDQEAGLPASDERGVASSEAPSRQVSAPVHGEAIVRRLASGGVTTYVEVGPGTVLSGLVLHSIQRESTSISGDGLDELATVESAIHV
jgi:acyl transferase domain-containing protein